MVERHIRLNATEDVKEFVNEATKCDLISTFPIIELLLMPNPF